MKWSLTWGVCVSVTYVQALIKRERSSVSASVWWYANISIAKILLETVPSYTDLLQSQRNPDDKDQNFNTRFINFADDTLRQLCALQVDNMMELFLNVCTRAAYFQFENKLYQQKCANCTWLTKVAKLNLHGAMWNVTTGHSRLQPTCWLRYIEDKFVSWPHRPVRLQKVLYHITTLSLFTRGVYFKMDSFHTNTITVICTIRTNH